MWFVMESAQTNYDLSDRLIRAISNLRTFSTVNDDIEQLIDAGADVNRLHGTLLPLQCACMVSDAYCLQYLLEKGALVSMVHVMSVSPSIFENTKHFALASLYSFYVHMCFCVYMGA
jgi:hypothetical protein